MRLVVHADLADAHEGVAGACGASWCPVRGGAAVLRAAAGDLFVARPGMVSVDSTARIWDATTFAELAALTGHASPLSSASFSADGSRIITTSEDETAKIWDVTVL